MDKLFLLIDIDRCYGCKICQTACKMEHSCPTGVQSCIEPLRIEHIDESGKLHCDFVPTVCQHCNNAKCIEKCPVSAISKNGEGMVIIDTDKCIGCGACERACPYGAVEVAAIAGKKFAYKCDLCADRRSRGMEPACVQHCIGQAIKICGEETMKAETEGRYTWSCGETVYVSSKISNLVYLKREEG